MKKCKNCGKEILKRKTYCDNSCQLSWEYANGTRVSKFKGMCGKLHPRYKHGESKGSKTICILCDKEFIRKSHKQKYCSQKCQLRYEYKNGLRDKFEITKNANEEVRTKSLEKFKTNPTTYISKRGYKEIYIPGKGHKKYHHYVWEQSGRKIPEGFCLHHINKNKLDNRLKNLIMLTHKDHHKLHDAERERDENGRYI